MTNQPENKARRNVRKNFSENRIYYEKSADKYHIVKYIVIFFLLIFVLLMLLFGGGRLRLDNFRYLAKTMAINPVSLDEKYANITYAAGNGVYFSYYKDDLAVLGNEKLSLYDMTGEQRFHDSIASGNMAVVSSEKYLAVFAAGGKSVSLYNSFSCVHEESFSSPIGCVSVGDTGAFAVCLKEEEGSVLYVYDESFEQVIRLSFGDALVYDLDFSPDGKRLAVTTLATNAGVYFSKLSVFKLSDGGMLLEETFTGKKPIMTAFFEDGRFFAVVDGMIVFYQESGKQTETVPFSAESAKIVCDGEQIAVLTNASYVSLYSSRGEALSDFRLAERALEIKMEDGVCYVLSEADVASYDENGEELARVSVKSGVLEFFVLEDGSVLLCYVSETDRLIL